MNLKKTIATGIIISAFLAASTLPALAIDSAHAKLIHVGLNPSACTGPFAGPSRGQVEVQTSDKTKAFKLEVNVHGAIPNRKYDVDIRCVGKIGTLKTDDEGEGEAEIKLTSTPSSPFYIDISIFGGGGGAGGYGDTFISGPFTLK